MSNQNQGFTLIETLVAFVILSLALMISTQTVALATKSLTHAKEDRLIRSELARIDEAMLSANTQAPAIKGQNGDVRWQIRRVIHSGEVDAPALKVVALTTASGREIKFLRFGGGAQ